MTLSERAQAMIDAARGTQHPTEGAKPFATAFATAAHASDSLLQELEATVAELPTVTVITEGGERRVLPPTSGTASAAKRYSPIEMVEFLIANPNMPLKQIALTFGRNMSWLSAVVASDAFQRALDPRRNEVCDPFFTSTMDERFRALALRSNDILLQKLDAPGVSDMVVLKATELSIKALGMGIAPPVEQQPAERKLTVAEKMAAAMEEMDRRQAEKTIDAVMLEVPEVKNE